MTINNSEYNVKNIIIITPYTFTEDDMLGLLKLILEDTSEAGPNEKALGKIA